MKNERTLQLIKDIFSEGRYDNDFFNLISGYFFVDRDGKRYNTGIIGSEHISIIIQKYNFINWKELTIQSKYIEDFRIRYILRIIKFITSNSRFKKEILFDKNGNINLVYITSNKHVFEDKVHLNTKVKFSYTVPFIYTSTFNDHFSECSVDIFKDRLSQKVRYDKGIIVNIDNKNKNEFFYIDRKANISNINWYIKNSVEKNEEYRKIFNNKNEVERLKKFLSGFLSEIKGGLDNRTIAEKIIHVSNVLEFSFFGFLLFEIIHEYFIEKGCHIFRANQLIRIISPNQFVLWSMRSFTISSFREMLLKLSAVFPEFNDNEFIDYVAEEFSYRIYLFVGAKEEFLEDCIAVSLFSKKVHAIELSEVDVDESRNIVSSKILERLNLNPKTQIFLEKTDGGFNIKNPSIGIPKLIEISDRSTKSILERVYKNYLIKACYADIRTKMKEEIVDYMLDNDTLYNVIKVSF